MPERVARTRIIVGSGDGRKVIAPGTRFKTEEYDIDSVQLKAWDDTGVVRRLRDQAVPVPAGTGPREGETVVEGRSGPVSDATSDMPNRRDARTDEHEGERRVPRRGRRDDNPDDL